MNPFDTHGAPSWAELLAADADKAAAFYANVFGWDDHPMQIEGTGGHYHIMKAGSTNAAGIMTRPDPSMPPCWCFYITVEDADGMAAQLQKAGAKEVSPVMEAPGIGRFCWFLDPQGAYLAVISYFDREGEEMLDRFEKAFATHGLFSWLQLQTKNVGQACDFYSGVFGWKTEVIEMATGPYLTIMVGDAGVGGVMPITQPEVPPHWSGYVTVGDADAALARAVSGGGSVVLPAFDVSGVGRLAQFADPQGAHLAIAAYEKQDS